MPFNRALTLAFQEVKILLNNNQQGGQPGDPAGIDLIPPLLAARLQDPAEPLTPANLPARLCALQEQAPAAFPNPLINAVEHLLPADRENIIKVLNRLPAASGEQDPWSAAFQVFQVPGWQSREGQYFTPPEVADQALALLNPQPGQSLLDPACGAGALLSAAARWQRDRFPAAAAPLTLTGWDTDPQAVAYARAALALLNPPAPPRLEVRNGLVPAQGRREIQALAPTPADPEKAAAAGWDLILANPPFGGQQAVQDPALLQHYRLGHKWVKRGAAWQRQQALRDRQQPQLLFLERCLQLLKPGGQLALILPDGHLSNPQDQYLREYMTEQAAARAVFSLPEDLFHPYTGIKTSLLLLEKQGRPRPIRMAAAPERSAEAPLPEFQLPPEEVVNHIYAPGYYHPELRAELDALRAGGEYELTSLRELEERGLLAITRPGQIPADEYGGGEIPLIRTSDLGNWEVNEEPKHRVSPELYAQVRESQDLQPRDIIFVHDGKYLIGKTAMLTALDLPSVLQGHLRKIRVLQPESLDPYLLLYLLNGRIVRRQIAAKTFVQGTLATLGDRLPEVLLAFPADPAAAESCAQETALIIQNRAAARARLRQLLAESP